jgi:5-methylcytosine-specific restriction protein B
MHDYDYETQYYKAGQNNAESYKCELSVDANLWDKPILPQEVEQNEKLQKLKVGIQGTNFSATQEEFEELVRIGLKRLGPETSPKPIWPINKVVDLKEISSMSGIQVEALTKWVRAIERKGQAIIYGPPGTGKTFIAEHLAAHLMGGGNGFSELVQFHPAYAYEDFIQGIRPSATGESTLCYTMTPGRFLDLCTRARKRNGTCVLIIDEINRANLARVFGELMYLLEYRNKAIPLAGGQCLSIPENVRLIGTMNTADRSIALVDHALRRRFSFIALRPHYEILIKKHSDTGFPVEKLVSILKKLNGVIDDPHYEVGISFFIVKDLAEHIEDIWCMEIEPYIEEYFFDQPSKVDEFRWGNIGKEILS